MDDTVTWWKFEEVATFMKAGFEAVGVPSEEAEVCTDVLIAADKRGVDSTVSVVTSRSIWIEFGRVPSFPRPISR
jgi:LDH2 family malate/lactate/ureidoglycolate dehydrogenase